jgi:hypothetical protein
VTVESRLTVFDAQKGTDSKDRFGSKASHPRFRAWPRPRAAGISGCKAKSDFGLSLLAHCISGADVPSDQCVTGTMMTLRASGESWNCGFSIGGAPGESAPHVEPWLRGK